MGSEKSTLFYLDQEEVKLTSRIRKLGGDYYASAKQFKGLNYDRTKGQDIVSIQMYLLERDKIRDVIQELKQIKSNDEEQMCAWNEKFRFLIHRYGIPPLKAPTREQMKYYIKESKSLLEQILPIPPELRNLIISYLTWK